MTVLSIIVVDWVQERLVLMVDILIDDVQLLVCNDNGICLAS